jgi:hypothetical protein
MEDVMKSNKIYGALMILALALLVSVPMTQAQARTRATVPFAFSLDQKSTMPAGTYEISSASEGVLVVRNLDTRQARLLIASMHVAASQASGTPHAKLVFQKYGDQYFLSQIWDGQSHTGIAFPESKREKELQTSSNGASQPELVVIAMK